jgi:hypothetical protein
MRAVQQVVALAVIGAAAAAGCVRDEVPVHPRAAAAAERSQQSRVPGEYIVTLAASGDVKAVSDLYGRFGIKEIRKLGPDVFLLILTDDPGPATMDSLRANSPRIKAIEPNYVYGTQGAGGAQ